MFLKKYEDRLVEWKNFRDAIETSQTPIEDTIEFWSEAPISSIATDPYNQETWPDPWQMIEENIFCPFVKILAICYTLQLTERFSGTEPEIHIVHDTDRSETKTLLFFKEFCIGYDENKVTQRKNLPENLLTERRYWVPVIQ